MTAKRPPTTGPRCGTYAGYQWHRRRNQHPCLPCCLAQNQYKADRRLAPRRRAILAEAVGTGSYGGRAS